MTSILGGDIEVQAVLVCILVCIITTIYWFWYRQSKIKNAAVSQDEKDNGCNDPNCIRCHSSSKHHIETFKANVTTLRRLVKMEPALFDGMRDEIWSTIDNMLAEHSKIDTSCAFPSVTPNTSIDTTSNTQLSSLLSPQQGQDPTVFFLPGLEATPFHHHGHFLNTTVQENGDESLVFEECICIRLWKTHTAIPATPVGKKVFPPPVATTGDIQVLIENYQIIKQELLDYLSDGDSEESFTPFDSKVYTQANNNTSNNDAEWSSIYLYHQGIRQSDLCSKHFPQTSQILEMNCPHRMAGKCGLGSVYFSKLKKNTKVKEHCGPSNVRWRCHLPLVVPKNSNHSQLRVGLSGVNEECVGWKEGVPILFDDSFVHSAVHQVVEDDENTPLNTDDAFDGARIVLIVDFWHPALSEMDRNALGVLYPPGS